MATLKFINRLERSFGFDGPASGNHYRRVEGQDTVEVDDADVEPLVASGDWEVVGSAAISQFQRNRTKIFREEQSPAAAEEER